MKVYVATVALESDIQLLGVSKTLERSKALAQEYVGNQDKPLTWKEIQVIGEDNYPFWRAELDYRIYVINEEDLLE